MKKTISVLYAFLASILITTSALAGGSVKLSSVTFSLGSLIANGTLTGLGNSDVTVVLYAKGIPEITCTNYGNSDVPGQSSPMVSASGRQVLPGNNPLRKNGKSPFGVETYNPSLTWDEAGCPNSNWSARVDFVFWTEATLGIHLGFNNPDGPILASQNYTCETTRNPDHVTCTPLP